MGRSEHPDTDLLTHWINGSLPANQADAIESHVQDCGECAQTIERVAPASPLIAELGRALADAQLTQERDELTGVVLAGRYKLIERIGAGGMGTVWKAEQFAPVCRLVAVKLLNTDLDSSSVLNRFEAERQALALMDHPNIAKVFDGGVTPIRSGVSPSYFVMEYVDGIPITQFCDERQLSIQQRLELFIPICQAIQHAHQKGIIHRDIKPSNVLVTQSDQQPLPKVIDFGIAKAVGGPLSGTSSRTKLGTLVGTPEYMSPEQASFDNVDIDTRSDGYSLGVMLYELLTGTTPHPIGDARKSGLFEVLRQVRDVDPPLPSQRLKSSLELPTLAQARGTSAQRLIPSVRGELDLIVLKCLEKDRNLRYESANAIADDLRRHLTGEPVRAVPPTTTYRIRKFTRKHRGPLIAVAMVLFALTLGITGATIGLIRAEKQRQLAQVAEKSAELRLKQVTTTHADLIWLVSRVTMQLKEKRSEAALQTLVSEIGRITDWIDQAEIADKKLRYDLCFRSGHALRVLEKYPAASRQLEKAMQTARAAFGDSSPQMVGTLIESALVQRRNGNDPGADQLKAHALAAFKTMLEAGNTDRADLLSLLLYLREWADEPELALRLAEHMLATLRNSHSPNESDILAAVHHLAWAKLQRGDLEEAAKLQSEVLQGLARRTEKADQQLLQSVANDAQMLFQRAGRIDAESFEILRRVFPGDTLDNAVLAVWGHELLRMKEWHSAEPVLRECLRRREKADPDAWTTFNTRSMLGASLSGQRRFADAEPLLLNGCFGLLERRDKIPPTARERIAEAIDRLISLYLATDRPSDASKWQIELDRFKTFSKDPSESR